MPTLWWLRPVRSAARVGAHSAVVWNRVYFKPPAASRSAVGVWHGPPKALEAAKPTSSSSTTRTLGAPDGGRSGSIGGKLAAGSLASNTAEPVTSGSAIGRVVRESGSELIVVLRISGPPCGAPDTATLGRRPLRRPHPDRVRPRHGLDEQTVDQGGSGGSESTAPARGQHDER